jgi:hypothetical protein
MLVCAAREGIRKGAVEAPRHRRRFRNEANPRAAFRPLRRAPTMLSEAAQYGVVISMSFLFFGASFVASWLVCGNVLWPAVWKGLTTAEKADWCSRFNSTVHGVVVVPAFIVTLLLVEWDADWYPAAGSSMHAIRGVMGFTLGYFAADFVIIVAYRVPMFPVFIVHHIVASIPYYQNLFFPSCRDGTIAMAIFLLVEFATVFLNAQSWLETCGKAGTPWHTFWLYATMASWVVSRLAVPALGLYIWYDAVLLSSRATQPAQCTAIVSVCGHIIVVFCWAVFLFVLAPVIHRRWFPSPAAEEPAVLEAEAAAKNEPTADDTPAVQENYSIPASASLGDVEVAMPATDGAAGGEKQQVDTPFDDVPPIATVGGDAKAMLQDAGANSQQVVR